MNKNILMFSVSYEDTSYFVKSTNKSSHKTMVLNLFVAWGTAENENWRTTWQSTKSSLKMTALKRESQTLRVTLDINLKISAPNGLLWKYETNTKLNYQQKVKETMLSMP